MGSLTPFCALQFLSKELGLHPQDGDPASPWLPVGQTLTEVSLGFPLVSLPCSLGLGVSPDPLLQHQAHGAFV